MPAVPDLLLGTLPGILWLLYLRRSDRVAPEPRALVARVFALGIAAGWMVATLRPRLEIWLMPEASGLTADLADAFLVTAGGEELAKLCAFALGALWHVEWDEPMDGIIYGAAAGLGFASIENAYFLAADGDLALVVSRAFTANLAHVVFSAGLGFMIGLSKLYGRSLPAVLGILGAVGLHGVYDLLLFADEYWGMLALIGVLPLGLGALALKMRWARSHPRLTMTEEAAGARS